MIGIGAGFAALGIGQKLARIGIGIGVLALIVGLIWWRIDAYGDSRELAGVTKTDAKWEEAVQKLREQAAQSATRADDAAVKRLEQFEQQAEDERKAVDEAISNGDSPIDVLFGG